MATKKQVESLFYKLGIKPGISTFNDRIKLQKIVYLTEEAFNVKLGFSSSYSWYLHGPYSPLLTQVMFEKTKGISIKITDTELEKIRKARQFFNKFGQTANQLELLGSLHYILKITEKNKSNEGAIEWFSKLKPQYSKDEIKEAANELEKLK